MSAALFRSYLSSPALVLPLVALVGGCAHVKPEQLETELSGLRAELRGEISQGDQALAGRVTDLQGRVDGLAARTDALERELTRLGEELDATVERFEETLRFNMPLYFGFDEAELTEAHREMLDRFAGVVREYYSDCTITVEGFTDPVGGVEYNRALGLRRAEAVRAWLAGEGGLTGDRLRAVSYGEASPRLIAPGEHGPGSKGWENRRVALVVDHGGA